MKVQKTLSALALLTVVALTGTDLFASSQPNISNHNINFASGNKYLVETDIQLAGPGKSLTFKRTYNSQSSANGVMGYGWSSPSSDHLIIDGTKITRVLSTGRHVSYSEDGQGGWVKETGKSNTIVEASGGYQLTKSNGAVNTYDRQGLLVESRDRDNYIRTFTYSGDQLASVSDSFGHTLTLTYNANGKLESVASPVGTYTYTYDANDNLISVTQPNSTASQYIYDDPYDAHNLTGILDEENTRTLTVTYDSTDRIVTSAFAEGQEQVTIEYLPDFTRSITDSLGVVTTYQLTASNGVARVTSSTGPGCSSCGSEAGSTYVYNDRQLVSQKTDASGKITEYTYDDQGNKLTKKEIKEDQGNVVERLTTMTYVTDTSLVETVTKESVSNPAQQNVITYTYDGQDNLISQSETGYNGTTPIRTTTTYTYDSFGRIASVDGPRTDVNDTTMFTYYPNTPDQGKNRGNLHIVTNTLGHQTTYSGYNEFGKPQIITTPRATITKSYDLMGRLLSREQGGVVTSYTYSPTGKLTTINLPDNRTMDYSYTPDGTISSIEDSLSNTISYSHDSRGQKIREEIIDPQGQLQHYVDYTYHDSGKLDTTTYADGSTQQLDYDDIGNLIARINALDNTTSYTYDAFNRLASMIEPGSVTTSYNYNSNDNLTSVTDAENNSTSFTYDDMGSKLTRTSPDTGTTTYQYDEAGNLISSTDAYNITTSYSYDSIGRLLSTTYSDTSRNVYYTYDENGNIGQLTSMQDSSGTTSYNYDSLGRLISEARTMDGFTFSTSYTYNDNNQLSSVTYPSGREITYFYNTVGQATTVETTYMGRTYPVASNITSLPFGPITSMTFVNGLQVQNSYDQLYRLTRTTAGSLFDRGYSYTLNGLLETISYNTYPVASSRNFIYDDLNRLLSSWDQSGESNYSYDNVGNRLSHETKRETTYYTYQANSNRLIQTAGTETATYNYHSNGNPWQKGDIYLNWGKDNRLKDVVDWNGLQYVVYSYGYDGKGLRVKRTVGGEARYFVYDQGGNLLSEMNGFGQTLREYVYLGTERIAMADYHGGTQDFDAYFFISDHLGTGQLLVDIWRQIVWQGDYQPFGKVDVVVDNVENNFRFPGQYYDAETGLHYNWHRYYDPATGRYITADPIGLRGGMNLYAYVSGNPVNRSDFWGLFGPGGPDSEFPGHDDFSGSDEFDFNLEDTDPATSPTPWGNPAGHFQALAQSEDEIREAIENCDREAFERAMHRGQDFFTHFNKGYRWNPPFELGHALDGTAPDRDTSAWIDAEVWGERFVDEFNSECQCQ